MSLTGPVDLDTFHLQEDVWEGIQRKTAVFVKLGTYLLPEGDRSPYKGIHICHVLLIFPIEQQPWRSLLGWMRESTNPFPKGSWVACSGRILGVLNRALIKGPHIIDSTVRILVVLPDNWEFIRQNSLSAQSGSIPAPTKPFAELPTPPRPAGPGGVGSWNPFSSPTRERAPVQEKPASQKQLSQQDQTANKASVGIGNDAMSAKGKEVKTFPGPTIRASGRFQSFLIYCLC